jgi:hypothetical protein
VLLGGLLLPDGVERHDPVGQELALVRPHGPLRNRATIAGQRSGRDGEQSQAADASSDEASDVAFPAARNRR